MLPIGLVAAVATLASLAMAVPEVVELPNGRSAQGTTQGGIRSFLGMPYAQPPVNGLRFAAPVPVNSSTWSGLRKFSQYGNRCYDLSKGDTGLFAVPGIVYASKQNEDCLNLNVLTPVDSSSDKPLPVMVYIYGGSFASGSADYSVYRGDALVRYAQREKRDFVYVSMNYRLNSFGFLASETLRNASTDGSTGNFGLQDQRLALKWVQENIKAFGGDPTRVTLFGHSAGSISAHLQSLNSKSDGLFSKVILISGYADSVTDPRTLPEMDSRLLTLAGLAKCPNSTATEAISCLRTVSADDLQTATVNLGTGWGPCLDKRCGEFAEDPRAALRAGRVNTKVPILLGSLPNEGSSFVPTSGITKDNYLENLNKTVGPQEVNAASKLYPFEGYKSGFFLASDVFGDSVFVCPAITTAILSVKAGVTIGQYRFTAPLDPALLLAPNLGVFHGTEVLFLYESLPSIYKLLLRRGPKYAGRAIQDVFTRFAVDGTLPDAAKVATDVRPDSVTALQIGAASFSAVQSSISLGSYADKCALWSRRIEASIARQSL